MTADNDIVLPNFTSAGEPTCISSEEGTSLVDVSVIYSSIPPDVNTESMARATKSSVSGEMLRISKRPDGKLSIFACESERTSPSVYERGHHSVCVVCHRHIADREMFLNFPDDLDRRRLWGNILGFKYSDMLRLRDGSVMLSAGHICTDHFSEECFRVFNFNKAAIEALGMPSVVSPGVRLTPSKKWIPWDCTVCSFQSHSVCTMQKHMIQHTDDVILRYHRKSPRGLLCPFCRKCTYGYKTMSGLRRHLMTPPIHHCQLKRIFETSRANCRSSLLEPVMKWSSWTDRNVYLAYHGCEPPPRTPRKRPCEDISTQFGSSDNRNVSSNILHNLPNWRIVESSSKYPLSAKAIFLPISDKVCETKIVSKSTPAKAALPEESTQQQNLIMVMSSYQNPRRSLTFSPSPIKNDSFGQTKPSRTSSRPILQLRKPLLPHDAVHACKSNSTADEESCKKVEKEISIEEKCRTVAKVILKATSTSAHTLVDALNLIYDGNGDGDGSVEDPAIMKPLFPSDNTVSDLSTSVFSHIQEPQPNKTRRQLESLEARLRIFGDSYGVEVPSGYTAIETTSGVRLIAGGVNSNELSSRICLPRGRFVPISHP